MDLYVVVIFSVVAACLVLAVVGTLRREWKRRRELVAFAKSMGFSFKGSYWFIKPAVFSLTKRFTGADAVRNILRGNYGGREFIAFDCTGQDSGVRVDFTASRRQRNGTYWSACLHPLGRPFPDLYIRRYRLRDTDVLGFLRPDDRRDISFESDEFNRTFRVSSDDRKFAFDVCHPRMMEWLLKHPDWHFAFVGGYLGLTDGIQWTPDEFRAAFDLAAEFLDLIPEHVRREYGGPGRERNAHAKDR